MSFSSLRLLMGAVVLAVLAAAAFSGGCDRSPSAPSAPSPLPGLHTMLAEKVLGSATAPITMIEYSSLTCSHCADFHALTLPLIKSEYIDTGKVKFVYRDFPLDNGTALTASIVARCSGDRFFTVLDLLYQSQGTWAGSSNPTSALKSVVAQAGLSSAEVDACLVSADLRAGILAIKSKGEADYDITGTPTFFINGQRIDGAMPYGIFAEIFNTLLGL